MIEGMPPWMKWALMEVGVREVPGRGSNDRILAYRKFAKIPIDGDDSVIPWCAIFANAALEQSGYRGTRSPGARSFLNSAAMDVLKGPALGCFVVLSRGNNPRAGHVGIYRGESDTSVYLIDGNAGDKVSVSSYPKERIVGYAWPKDASPAPAIKRVRIMPGAKLTS